MRDRATTPSYSIAFTSVLALGLAVAGCTGMVGGDGPGMGNPDNGSGGMGTGNPSGGASGGVNPTAGASGGPVNIPGVSLMHRLNTAEYNATVADVLGTKLQPADGNWRGGEVDGFDNIAAVLGVNDDQVGLYVDAAEALANDVMASDVLRAKVVTCTTVDDMACIKTIIQQTGLRIFRRPILDTEVATYTKAYKAARSQGEDHNASVKEVLWALLSSAEFLYRMEFDNGGKTKHPVSGYELASRLSYFLWSSAPDDALLTAAPTLTTDAVINTTVDRLLADPVRSARFVNNFAGQWLGGRKVVPHAVDKTTYPLWSADVANAASAEVYSYFDEFLRKNRPWTEFLSADLNFVNGPLASIYGMTDVTGATTVRKENTADNHAGFMGLVGFLAVSSVDRRSSPTVRGKWVLLNLLCAPPPPPPANVPKLEDNGAKPEATNVRAVLEAHRAAPACNACHSVMDPFGLALEQFDGIGKFRTAYPDGTAIDPATELPKSSSFPDGLKFSGMKGAEDAVSSDPRFKTCIAEKLYTYGLGRSLSTEDKANSAAISKNWQTGELSINKLLHGLATSEAFKTRTPAP